MGIISTCDETVRITYRAPFFSRAAFFNAIIFILAIVGPYLIAYRTQGFWTKIDRVREQPMIFFKHEVLLLLDTKEKDGSTGVLMWTTFPGLSSMVPLTTPFIMNRENDHNNDGIHESLEISITIGLLNEEEILGVHLILLFDYKLMKFATLEMESMAYISYNSPRAGNHYEHYADLELTYKEPLWNRVRDTRYASSVIPRDSSRLGDYDIGKILRDYSARNVSTILRNKYDIWRDDQNSKGEFVLRARINYPETSYECWAGFWNTLKWAWVQYFAIFVVVASIVKKFQNVIYKSRLFEARVEVPWEKKYGVKSAYSQ